jgi:PBSX family phage terminase large subunit
LFLRGGSSAAKTYSVVQAILIDVIENKSNYMVLRKYGSDIEDSIFADFKGQIEDYNLGRFFRVVKNKISCINGAYIRFRGLDDSEKIKGLARIKRVILEELTQFEHEDFKQVRKRLRGVAGQQIIGMFNPINEQHWINSKIFEAETWHDVERMVDGRELSELEAKHSFKKVNEAGDMVYIKTTYRDNYYIIGFPDGKHGYRDEHVINDFERDKRDDYNYYCVYANGEWGKLDSGAEFYHAFKPQNHVSSSIEYDNEKPLHVSFDENVRPYLACTIYQADGNTIQQVDEITLEKPKNNLTYTLTEFFKRYRYQKAAVYLYGDATSRKQDAKLQKGQTFFRIIKNTLSEQGFTIKDRVPLSNPSVMIRGLWINDVLAGKTEIDFKVAEHCKQSIEDFRYLKEDADGKKLKETEKDSTDGVRFEKYGHTSDTFDYFLTKYARKEFENFQSRGKTKKRVAIKASAGIEY